MSNETKRPRQLIEDVHRAWKEELGRQLWRGWDRGDVWSVPVIPRLTTRQHWDGAVPKMESFNVITFHAERVETPRTMIWEIYGEHCDMKVAVEWFQA